MNQVLEQRVRERTEALKAEAKLRAEAESRLHQAQKMEAVGQLTGGIAHDFNNILQVILGNLEIARRTLQKQESGDGPGPRSEGVLRAIETAQRASRSAGQLVQRMLVFSRLQKLEPTSLDANALISDMEDMIVAHPGRNHRGQDRSRAGSGRHLSTEISSAERA
jgi:signal transduction histidine kinase